MTDRRTDGLVLLYAQCRVHCYDEGIRDFIMDAVKDLYRSDRTLLSRLQTEHIDRAIYKYRTAGEKRLIRNTLQYFKACIVSAIKEYDMDRQD